MLGSDGRGRAFVNDQPIGIALLREIGNTLVEIEVQFASRGLLNSATHRGALDAFAGLDSDRAKVASAWWISIIPGVAITLVVIAFNLFGDWLRDRLDPKLRQL